MESEILGTPLWMTIVGWCVTVIAAAIPVFVDFCHHKSSIQAIEDLKHDRAVTINRKQFLEERSNLIDELETFKEAFSRNNSGMSTYRNLEVLLTQIEGYSKNLKFDTKDQEEISLLRTQVSNAITVSALRNIRPAEIERIIMLLKKGEYSI